MLKCINNSKRAYLNLTWRKIKMSNNEKVNFLKTASSLQISFHSDPMSFTFVESCFIFSEFFSRGFYRILLWWLLLVSQLMLVVQWLSPQISPPCIVIIQARLLHMVINSHLLMETRTAWFRTRLFETKKAWSHDNVQWFIHYFIV